MRRVEIEVYKFAELDPKIRADVVQKAKEVFGYNWSDEALKSLTALAAAFDGKLADYSFSWEEGTGWARFDMPEMPPDEIKRRLKALGAYNRATGKGLGDCKLTGFVMDEYALDGFRAAFREGRRDLTRLMNAAFRSWLAACVADYEDQYSDATYAEHSDANEYEYTADGRIFREK